jgi:hypothetical protein
MRTLIFIFILMVSGGPAALAATVVGVNKGATRIILRLNKKEFSKIDTQDQLLMVVGKEGRYVIGLVRKLDPIKSNALVFLEEPQAWIKKKMKVQFKEGLWNSAFDVPMLTAPQYIQSEPLSRFQKIQPNPSPQTSETELKSRYCSIISSWMISTTSTSLEVWESDLTAAWTCRRSPFLNQKRVSERSPS